MSANNGSKREVVVVARGQACGREVVVGRYVSNTPADNAVAGKTSRNPAEIIAPAAERLTEALLAPGFGDRSNDAATVTLRKDVGKGRARPLHMIAAIAYDDIYRKGKSAAEVTAWAKDFVATVESWAAERDGEKVVPPDLTPLLRLSQRRENAENEMELVVAANQDSPAVLEKFVEVSEAEIEADTVRVSVVRARLARLLADLRGDSRSGSRHHGTPFSEIVS